MSVEDLIWIVIGTAVLVVVWIMWRNRATTVEFEPTRDEKLQKLFEELR